MGHHVSDRECVSVCDNSFLMIDQGSRELGEDGYATVRQVFILPYSTQARTHTHKHMRTHTHTIKLLIKILDSLRQMQKERCLVSDQTSDEIDYLVSRLVDCGFLKGHSFICPWMLGWVHGGLVNNR